MVVAGQAMGLTKSATTRCDMLATIVTCMGGLCIGAACVDLATGDFREGVIGVCLGIGAVVIGFCI
jgi:hypothetical protein